MWVSASRARGVSAVAMFRSLCPRPHSARSGADCLQNSATVSGMKKASEKKDSRSLKKNEPTPAAKERILVVDDEEPIREIICSMLTSAGYRCRTANDGLEALAMLDSGEQF